ncbi:MAG: patatin-like phospholipase family protein [Puniceicoccales bacterium]|jgi:predicted acylesterase/phospholipase RssA|nr:patatin-like phospholipase family protein [Puniceicoccales bacterium]
MAVASTGTTNPYALASFFEPNSDSLVSKEPTQSRYWTVLSVVFKCSVAVTFSTLTAITFAPGLITLSVFALVAIDGTSVLIIAITAIAIVQDCLVLRAVSGLSQEQLCDLWNENLKIIRPGGERAASGKVCQAQLLPCALAMRDRILARLREAGKSLGEERLQQVCDGCRRAFNYEWAIQEQLGFTCRMRYTSLDDFLFLMDYWAKKKLDLVADNFTGKRYDCISFASGGAKGLGYMPLLQLFSESDIFEKDCRFTGASAGALMAVCGAFGPYEVRNQILEMQRACRKFRSDPFLKSAYPSFSQNLGGGLIEWLGPIEVVDRYTSRQIQTFLQYLSIPDGALAELTESERDRLAQLRQPYNLKRTREPYMVRFSDINLMRKLPRGKEFFHDLSIAMWDSERNETVFANPKTTPDLPVAFAARISISIPLFFQGAFMPIPGLDPSDRPHHYYDGGIEQLAPDPKQAFGSGVVTNPFFCVPDSDGEPYQKEVQTGMLFSVFDRLLRAYAYTGDLSSRRKENWDMMKEKLCLVVPHGTIDTLHFNFSESTIVAVERQASLSALRKIMEIRTAT